MTTLEKIYWRAVRLPSLSENAYLRYFLFTLLYFAQGVPQGILWNSLPAWFAHNGKSPLEIASFIAIIGLPWAFKIVVAPFMDRFTYLPMGRRKPWLIGGQLGIVLAMLALALVSDPLNNLRMLTVWGFLLSLATIFQDISTDGMAIDLLPSNQQARANGLMWGGKILGVSFSVALTGFFLSQAGYLLTMLFLAGLISLILLVPLALKERACEKRFPWSKGTEARELQFVNSASLKKMLRSLLQVVFLKNSLIMGFAAFLFSVGRGLMDALLPIFTVQELGWSDIHYSNVFSSTSMLSGFVAMAIAGIMIDRWGKKRMFASYIGSLLIVVTLMAVLVNYWPMSWLINSYFFLFYSLDTFGTIAIFAIAMQLCWKRVAATQFTLYMAVSNLGLSAGAWLMGELKTLHSWQILFLSYSLLMLCTLILVLFLNLKKHDYQLDLLKSL